MKLAALDRELKKYPNLQHMVIHTGQHYDKEMSDVFFDQLGLPEPARHLGVGSGGHGEMTGTIMIKFEKVCQELNPHLVIVVGDVNSTIAASLVARKLSIPVAHVEAGLRSFDETMPEELNRRLTDCLSNLLFVSEPSGVENLQREGTDMTRVHLVGDTMLETLQVFLPAVRERKRWEDLGLDRGEYVLATIHRPSNVDDPQSLQQIVDILTLPRWPVIFPAHPRTIKRLHQFNLWERINSLDNIRLVPPLPYIDFLSLLYGSAVTLTDSGSLQAEASFFDVPCLVCRENTERPIYIYEGTATLVGRDKERVSHLLDKIATGEYPLSSPLVHQLGTGVGKKIVERISEDLPRLVQ